MNIYYIKLNKQLKTISLQENKENIQPVSHKSMSKRGYKSPSVVASGSYLPVKNVVEHRAKAEAARIQMEYEKQLKLRKKKADLEENEVKIKA